MSEQVGLHHKRRLIVVDDSATLRAVLRNALECFGYDVVGEAENGRDAVELYKEQQPDAVLLDIDMPDYNGIYALERITAIDPDSVVIMLTACQEGDIVQRCSSLGARGFLHKPFNMDRLHQEIRTLLGLAVARENKAQFSDEYVRYVLKPKMSLPHKTDGEKNGGS